MYVTLQLLKQTTRPGDHVVWKSEDEKRPAIVQSVNAKERTATVFFSDTGRTELASVLELDHQGASDLAAVIPESASEGLGVHRGDFVFIHREGATNGFAKPSVPHIGELQHWVREVPFAHGHLSGWRKEMNDIGNGIAQRRPPSDDPLEGTEIKQPDANLRWFREVTDVRPLILDISCDTRSQSKHLIAQS